MLALRPNCECCDKDLPADSREARICSFECTFCADCSRDKLAGVCPNCGSELVTRPRRPPDRLHDNPASMQRVHHPVPCSSAVFSAEGKYLQEID